MDEGHPRGPVPANGRGRLLRFATAAALVCLLALSLTACARAEASLAPSPAGNVNGMLLLKRAQADVPGAGILVTALSRKAHALPVSTRTAADGSFTFQLTPGWYLLAVDYWGAPAVQIHVVESTVTTASIVAPSRELAQTTRVAVNDARGVIPTPGVWMDSHNVLLRPAPRHLPAQLVSPKRAAAVALGGDKTAQAVLAVVSAPQRILAPHGPMRNWLTWVVVSTMQRPFNAVVGGMPGAPPSAPYLTIHRVSLIDARTGRFLLGFFTP
jgi:hypothetical protein